MLFLSDFKTAYFSRPIGASDKKPRKKRLKYIANKAFEKGIEVGGTAATLAALSTRVLNRPRVYRGIVASTLLGGAGLGTYKALKNNEY
jgi:hypothetical protein